MIWQVKFDNKYIEEVFEFNCYCEKYSAAFAQKTMDALEKEVERILYNPHLFPIF